MTVSNFTSRSYGPNGWQRMLVGDDGTSTEKPAIIYVPGGGWGLRDPLPFTDVATSTFTDPISWAVQNPLSDTSSAEDGYRLFVLNVASDANQSRAATGVTAGGNNPTGIASNTLLTSDVTDAATAVPIEARGNMFPKGGYIQIGTEIIKYSAIDETVNPPQLTGLQRGQLGTSAQSHLSGSTVTTLYWIEGESYPAGTIVRGLYRSRRTHISEAGVNQPTDSLESALTADYDDATDTTLTLASVTSFDKAHQVLVGKAGLTATASANNANTNETFLRVTSVAGFDDTGVLKVTATGGASAGLVEYWAYGALQTTPGDERFINCTREATGSGGRIGFTAAADLAIESVGDVEFLYSGVSGSTLTGLNRATSEDTAIEDLFTQGNFALTGASVRVPDGYFWEYIGAELDEAAGVQRIPGRGEGTPGYAAQAALDVQTAVSHIRKNAGELNVDPDKITVYGSSAGGHAVAIAAYGPDMIRTAPVDPRSVNAGRIADGRPNAVMLDITPAFLNEYVTTNVGNNGLFLSFMRDAYGIKGQALSFNQWGAYPETSKKSLDGAALISQTRKAIPTIFVSTAYKYSDRSPSQVQNGAATPSAWNAGTTYNQYDTASYSSKFWIAQRTTTGVTPGTNYDDWAQAGGSSKLAPEVHHAYNGWRYMRELSAIGETNIRLVTADDLDPAVRDVRIYTQVPADPSDQGTSGVDYSVTSAASAPKEALVDVGNAILTELAAFLA